MQQQSSLEVREEIFAFLEEASVTTPLQDAAHAPVLDNWIGLGFYLVYFILAASEGKERHRGPLHGPDQD